MQSFWICGNLAQVLADLEAQIAHHEERETFHVGQEGLHRSQRELHAGELAQLRERYESFKTAAQAAGAEVRRSAGRVQLVEEGRAFHEAVYTRGPG